jgi:hypothetical protein
MKSFIFLTAALILAVSALPARAPSQFERDFRLGTSMGQCFKLKCEIFEGVFLAGSPTPGSTVQVQVTRWLFGHEGFDLTSIELPFDTAERHVNHADKGGFALYHAWEGVKVAPNAPVTVALLLEPFGANDAGPLFAITDEHSAALVSSLSAEARTLQQSPTYISALGSQAIRGPNPAVGGFVYGVLSSLPDPFLHDFDLRATILDGLLHSESLPKTEMDWQAIGLEVILYFNKNSPGGRAAVVQRLSQLGIADDPVAAAAGINNLLRLSHMEPTLGSLLPADLRDRLAVRYIQLVASKKLQRDSDAEQALGFQATPR